MTEQPQVTTPVVVEQPQATLPPPPAPPEPVRGDRRVLRAVLRWSAAVLVLAAVGASTAYGVTRMERTDVPGLATESDGRWDYPRLTKPPLPSGSPGPFAGSNPAGAHYADLRALVLPAPAGATDDKALHGKDGRLAVRDFLAEYASKEDRDELRHELTDNGLRTIAARGWTTGDGTRTRIYLLQFNTAAVVDGLFSLHLSDGSPDFGVRGAGESFYDDDFPDAARVQGIPRTVYAENRPYGAEQVRQGYLAAGDVLAVILQSRKGTAEAVPFQQTVILQSQLLG